jgi:hypothetical protein
MVKKSNISLLQRLKRNAPVANQSKIQNIIDLYKDTKIKNIKTALNVATLLSSKILPKMGVETQRRIEDSYNKLITRYEDAKPMKGRILASIQERRPIYDMIEASLTKTNTNILIKINTKVKDAKGNEIMSFDETI